MGQKSATYVVSMVEDQMVNKSPRQNAAQMIFWNRMIRCVDPDKLPSAKDHVSIMDIRDQCGMIHLEASFLPRVSNDESFCHYIIGRFERMAGKRRW